MAIQLTIRTLSSSVEKVENPHPSDPRNFRRRSLVFAGMETQLPFSAFGLQDFLATVLTDTYGAERLSACKKAKIDSGPSLIISISRLAFFAFACLLVSRIAKSWSVDKNRINAFSL